MNAHTTLRDLGFGDYDAKAYLALLQAGEGNGYEIAKLAGVPRANVYAVLGRLVERGAARRFDTAAGTRYAATPVQELLAQLDQSHRRTLAAAHESLAALQAAEAAQPLFNLDGREELLAQAQATIDAARHDLLVAIQPTEAAALADPLRRARERGVAITTLCLEACAGECGGCQGTIHRLAVVPHESPRWLLLVADRSSAVIGQTHGARSQGVLTHQRLFLELATAYVRQSLALALLGDELAGRFDGLLSEQARGILERLYPDENFLAHIQSLGRPASA